MAYLCFYSAEGRGEGGKKVKQYLQLSCFQKGKRNRVHEKMRVEEREGEGEIPCPAHTLRWDASSNETLTDALFALRCEVQMGWG